MSMRKVFLVMLAVAVTVSLAASGQGSSAPAPAGKKSFSLVNTPYLQAPPPPDVDVNNNIWVDIFKREIPDIDIRWIIIPDADLNQRLNVMVGSGDIPDSMPMTMAQMISWSDMGVIQNLDKIYQTGYPNIKNFLNEDDLKSSRYNGRQYGIKVPGNRLENPSIMLIRTDWLDKLKLPMPKTIDEVYNVLRAFTFDDPDGNGKNDTYGTVGSRDFGFLQEIFFMFGVQPGVHFSQVGNQIIPDFIRPEMKEAINFITKLYKEGILDKDTLTIPNLNMIEDKAVRGLVGMFTMPTNGVAVRAYPNMVKANPNAKIDLFIPPAAPDGKIYFPVGRNGARMWGVSSKCNVPEAVLKFFNWMIEEDPSTKPRYSLNADKVYNGTLGVHSTTLGERHFLLIDQNLLSPQAVVDLWRHCYRTHMGTMQAVADDVLFDITRTRIATQGLNPIFLKAQETVAKYGKTNAAAVQGPVYAANITDINTYWEETIAGIVTGAKPITAWDDFVKFFYANNGQKIIDEITTLNK